MQNQKKSRHLWISQNKETSSKSTWEKIVWQRKTNGLRWILPIWNAQYAPFSAGVVSSAVCLLELCGLETEKLRVDVEAAKRYLSQEEHNVNIKKRNGALYKHK